MRLLDEKERVIPGGSLEYNRGFIGGLYVRPFGPVSKGYVHEGHAHYIDHAMEVMSGAVRVDWLAVDGRSGSVVIEAPNIIPVKAETSHRIESLIDGTLWRCIFAEAEADGLDADGPVPFNMEKAT